MKKAFFRGFGTANIETNIDDRELTLSDKGGREIPMARGSVVVVGNDIYVRADEEVMPVVTEIFNKYDRIVKQILIEARIVEASDDFSRSLGVNWRGSATSNGPDPAVDDAQWDITTSAINLLNVPSSGLQFGLNLISDVFALDATLSAMEATGQGRIVSSPRIMALDDGEPVRISQGFDVPYTTFSDEGRPDTQFKKADLLLEVTPHVEENGKIITMNILVTKDTPLFNINPENPPLDTKKAETRLMIRDGETVVIGGIIIDDTQKSMTQVPGLHKIPLFGNLFKSQVITNSKKELLIFLNANIVPVSI
jgi:type IV pilus assembly protein PilQ